MPGSDVGHRKRQLHPARIRHLVRRLPIELDRVLSQSKPHLDVGKVHERLKVRRIAIKRRRVLSDRALVQSLAVEDDAEIEVRKHTGVVQCQRFREALLRLIDAAEVGQ